MALVDAGPSLDNRAPGARRVAAVGVGGASPGLERDEGLPLGKKMDKEDVIYGKVALNRVSWSKIVEAVTPIAIPSTLLSEAKKTLAEARQEKLSKPYVKVGQAGNDLVLRIKEDKTMGKEIDAVLVKNYKQAVETLDKKTAKVVEEMNLTLDNGVDAQLDGLPEMFKRIRELIGQNKTTDAENDVVKVRTRFINIAKTLREPKEMAEATAPKYGVDPGEIDLKKFSERIARARRRWKELKAEFEKVEGEFDRHSESAGLADPVASKNDGNYRRDYQEVVDKFKETLEKLRPFAPKMQVIANAAATFPAMCREADDPAEPLKRAGQMFQAARVIEKQSSDQLFHIRERAGDCCTLRDAKNLDLTDRQALLPYMTRGMTLNQKVIALKESSFDLLEEGLDILIDRFDDPVAVDLIKRVKQRK